MPELPEVETVCRGLNQTTLNQLIQGGDVLLPRTIAHPVSVGDFLAGVQGSAIAQWQRRGKYLLAALTRPDGSAGGWLGVHLRMTGQLLWLTPDVPLAKHDRVRLFLAGDRELRFADQRTFGRLWWVPPGYAVETIITGLQGLGPEPFSAEFSADYLRDRLRHRQRPIKNALLDQAIVAGLGNIYADETLFLSGIRPQRLCTRLQQRHFQQLHANIQKVLQTSIEARGTTFRSFRNVYGINGNYGDMAWVYGRDGAPCRVCGTEIQRLKLAGRSAHFCPQCQK